MRRNPSILKEGVGVSKETPPRPSPKGRELRQGFPSLLGRDKGMGS